MSNSIEQISWRDVRGNVLLRAIDKRMIKGFLVRQKIVPKHSPVKLLGSAEQRQVVVLYDIEFIKAKLSLVLSPLFDDEQHLSGVIEHIITQASEDSNNDKT